MAYKSVDFSKFSSIKIGPKVDVFLVEDSFYPKDHFIIGSANNILMSDNPPPLMILDKKFDYIKIENDQLIIGCATPSGKISSFCKKNNIANFEFLSHLPGTIGGLIKMNAGLKEYETFNNLISIKVDDRILFKKDIDHGYRFTKIDGVIFEATFKLEFGYDHEKLNMFKTMRLNQPHSPSAGSCFKNPPNSSAGKLIDMAGLKGVRVGNMAFSEIHANFLINLGGGIFSDATELITLAQQEVLKKFDIQLEREVIIL
jgi:UDP-N-acetylmuramate dehydrogenase